MLQLLCFTLLLQASASAIRGRRHATANIFDPTEANIVGGTEAPAGKYPSYVHVTNGQLCGGTLIRPDVVLTAAHCATAFNSVVLVGSSVISGGPGSEIFTIKEILPHENYESGTEHNDIMLVFLDTSSTAPLTALNFNEKVPVGGEAVKVIGFGNTSEGSEVSDALMEVEVQVIAMDDCQKWLPTLVDEEMNLCAGEPEGGKDSCSGDSGGPLYDSKSGVQYGIVSFGVGCAHENKPGVYTRISTYSEWMSKHICEKSTDPGDFCNSMDENDNDTEEETPNDEEIEPETTEDGELGKPEGVGAGKPEKKPEDEEVEAFGNETHVGEGKPEWKPELGEFGNETESGGIPESEPEDEEVGLNSTKPEKKPDDGEAEDSADGENDAFNSTLDDGDDHDSSDETSNSTQGDGGKPDGVWGGKPEWKPERGDFGNETESGGIPESEPEDEEVGLNSTKPEKKPDDGEAEDSADGENDAFNSTLDDGDDHDSSDETSNSTQGDGGKPDGVGHDKPEKNSTKPDDGEAEDSADGESDAFNSTLNDGEDEDSSDEAFNSTLGDGKKPDGAGHGKPEREPDDDDVADDDMIEDFGVEETPGVNSTLGDGGKKKT